MLLISHFINPETFAFEPTAAQLSTWTTLTCLVPDLPLTTTLFDRTQIPCPICSTNCSVPWITVPELKSARERKRDESGGPRTGEWKGKGRAQEGMVARCEKCCWEFGKEEMQVKKFLKDCDSVLGVGGNGEGEGPTFPFVVLCVQVCVLLLFD